MSVKKKWLKLVDAGRLHPKSVPCLPFQVLGSPRAKKEAAIGASVAVFPSFLTVESI